MSALDLPCAPEQHLGLARGQAELALERAGRAEVRLKASGPSRRTRRITVLPAGERFSALASRLERRWRNGSSSPLAPERPSCRRQAIGLGRWVATRASSTSEAPGRGCRAGPVRRRRGRTRTARAGAPHRGDGRDVGWSARWPEVVPAACPARCDRENVENLGGGGDQAERRAELVRDHGSDARLECTERALMAESLEHGRLSALAPGDVGDLADDEPALQQRQRAACAAQGSRWKTPAGDYIPSTR
jgi:hypothetical protein